MTQDPTRDFLRHTLATLAYRGGKALRDAPPGFAEFKVGDTTRSPAAILAHIGDLLDWAVHMARGEQAWQDSAPLDWDLEIERFFRGIARLDAYLASGESMACRPGRLFQGPIADALTHVGQLTLMRRLAGAPIRGENYARAAIVAGRAGPDQAEPMREFD